MRPFTLVMPYYQNPGMLRVQQDVWAALPEDIRAQLHVIVVDDASPTAPAAPHLQPSGVASFRLYRTGTDVRWNWLFCRNLGVSEATTDWVFLTDIDHIVPEQTWRVLMTERLHDDVVYRFSRVDAPAMTPYKPHPNTWCMTRAMFDRIGGYDERFSGFYGTDGEFRDRVVAASRKVVMRSDLIIRYERSVVPDASTTTYVRKAPYDRPNVCRIIAERNAQPDWRTKRLTFPWERVC